MKLVNLKTTRSYRRPVNKQGVKEVKLLREERDLDP